MVQRKLKWPGPLEGHDPEDYFCNVVDDLQWPWGDLDRSEELRAELAPQSLEFFAMAIADGQIDNGGFTQFFENSYGELAEEAVLGFRRFGMSEIAELFEEVYNFFGHRPVPKDRNGRQKLLYSKFGIPKDRENIYLLASPTMRSFNDRYYKLVNQYDFLRTVCHYVDSNRSAFFIDAITEPL